MSDSFQEDPLFPAGLSAELKRAYQPPAHIPGHIDAAVLAGARAHFAHRRRQRMLVRWGGASAIAASLLVAALLTVHPHGTSVALRGDLNHDGRVDIVDAFLLARQLQAGGKPAADADFCHDGVIDNRDVQILARAAVSLKPVELQ